MFRHAEEKDRAALLDYLRRESEFNLFIIGDVLSLGVRGEDIDVYLQARRGAIEAVLMRYRNNFIPYTREAALDLSAVTGRINTSLATDGTWFVSGKKEIVHRVKPGLQRAPAWEREQFFAVCRELRADVPAAQLPSVRTAAPDDAEAIAGLWDAVFGGKEDRRLRQDIEQEKTRVAFIRDAASGEVVSSAACVAESDAAAMIIGVATHPDHRGKGYATACVWRLVSDLRARGKSACLFFHNPAAGTIYRRLGFQDIGMWKMMKFEKPS